jgi:HSPB1-associated protein 1
MSSEFPSTPLVIRKAVDLSAGSVLLDALLGADYERRPEDVDAVRASCRDVRLCDAEMDWRISPIGTGRTIREYESIIRRASFRQFAEWLNAGADTELQTDHPFADLPKYSDKEVSIYADYKHFNELFGSSSACINDKYIGFYGSKVILVDGDQKREIISWNEIMRKGHVTSIIEDSSIPTLWLSSDKAHSPLHYDTYGKNIVVQMSGRKRWLLWPASSPVLVPLRIPFEESSVYSEFDPLEFMSRYGTDEEGIMAMRTAHPGLVEVVLEPGDALLVPPHVWHFVETVRIRERSD